MKMKNIKYMAAWAAVLFAFSACQDIVEVEDLKAKDDIPSTGAPEITKIVLANDAEFEIDGADFEDMVRIEGKNLGDVCRSSSTMWRSTPKRFTRVTKCCWRRCPVSCRAR